MKDFMKYNENQVRNGGYPMIYTVTFNPAIDYVVHAEKLELGSINRSKGEEYYVGGKGINVSLVLKELGVESRALGFVAGFTGLAIEQGVNAESIATDFVHLKEGCSRINVKMKAELETDLNGQGPEITDEALQELFDKLDGLSDGDTLVLAGSIPKGVPENVYEQILERLTGRNVRAVVDATGNLLLRVMKYRPFLVKPNNFELGELFDVEIKTVEEIEKYAKKLQEMGAKNVLVSMAEEGAFLLDENGRNYRIGTCRGKVKNSVGAGDSMVAGFLAGLESGDYEYALKLGTAAGGATAFSLGLAKKELILEMLAQLQNQ